MRIIAYKKVSCDNLISGGSVAIPTSDEKSVHQLRCNAMTRVLLFQTIGLVTHVEFSASSLASTSSAITRTLSSRKSQLLRPSSRPYLNEEHLGVRLIYGQVFRSTTRSSCVCEAEKRIHNSLTISEKNEAMK